VNNPKHPAAEEENRPLIKKPSTDANQNVFKMDEQVKPKTPAWRGANAADAWPQAKPQEDIGNKIKSYIKDMNKLIDAGAPDCADDDDDDDDDDDNIEEVPSVPETDDNQKQAARDDAIEDEACME